MNTDRHRGEWAHDAVYCFRRGATCARQPHRRFIHFYGPLAFFLLKYRFCTDAAALFPKMNALVCLSAPVLCETRVGPAKMTWSHGITGAVHATAGQKRVRRVSEAHVWSTGSGRKCSRPKGPICRRCLCRGRRGRGGIPRCGCCTRERH